MLLRIAMSFELRRNKGIDPRVRSTVATGSDNCFCKCRPFVRPYPLFNTKHISSENNVRYSKTVGLAKWIIDDTCLLYVNFVALCNCLNYTVNSVTLQVNLHDCNRLGVAKIAILLRFVNS